uniref:CMP-N-acetylneuraminate-beta-galactosamide-alpha-2,3-sialyltransferase 1 n=1 Tax=Fundulus heteroclitus TaxID=8078 RepID=A0A3Q2PNX5_FUNHE
MTFVKRRKFRTFALLLCVITFTTLLFSYTFRDPSLYFFKYAFRLSDSFFSKGPCACEQCIAEPGGDPWFAERFNLSIHPLMTRENSVLSEETYKWWQWLQSERQPANFTEVVEELFQVIPDVVLYMDAGPERCRSCAVVGNSGNLKGSHYGGEPPFLTVPHYIPYPSGCKDLLLLQIHPKRRQARSSCGIICTYLPVMPRIKANKEKVLIYSPTFFKYVHESWLEGHGRYPSTGFLSLLLALHICDEVSVFGFGADQYGNWHHYWEENHLAGAFRHTGVHDGDYEYNVTLLLADKHKIQMFSGR